MTNTDIVIPRSELPETMHGINHVGPHVTLANHPANLKYRISADASAHARKLAYEQLAVAEAIDYVLAEQEREANKARSVARAKYRLELMHEASQLCFAATGDNIFRASLIDSNAYEDWLNVARAARELHGK